jgi:hypothetical protein
MTQQQLLAAMKSQVLSPEGFIRLPWIAWATPQTLETDMGPGTLAGVASSLAISGSGKTQILAPTGAIGSDLTITDAAKQADVARFLRG